MPLLTLLAANEIRYIARLYVQRVHAVMLRGHKKPKWKSLYFPSFPFLVFDGGMSDMGWNWSSKNAGLLRARQARVESIQFESFDWILSIFPASRSMHITFKATFCDELSLPDPIGDGTDCMPSHSTVKYALSSAETPRKCIKIKCCASCHPFVCFFGAVFAHFSSFPFLYVYVRKWSTCRAAGTCFHCYFYEPRVFSMYLPRPQSQPVYRRWRWAWIIFHLNLFSNLMVGVPIARSEHWRNCSQRCK